MTTIDEPREVTDELVAAVGRLVGQLSSTAPAPTRAEVEAIVASSATRLLVAHDANGVVGMLTLAVFRIPTGMRAWIEDVVVDTSARGMGVGEALSRHALALADGAGAKTVELTSRPTRQAANRLYRRLGFQLRETNVYRHQRPPG